MSRKITHIIRLNPSHLCVTRVPTFTIVGSAIAYYLVTGHFVTSAPNDPKLTLSTRRSNLHVGATNMCSICDICHCVPNVNSFCSVSSHYRDSPFWKKCTQWPPNDLEHLLMLPQRCCIKLPFNTTWLKVPHILYVLLVPTGPKVPSTVSYVLVAGYLHTK